MLSSRPHLSASVVLALVALLTVSGRAANKLVDSIAALQAGLAEAVAGDTLVVKNGVYTTNQAIAVNRSGTAGQPITITAETVGGVEITGTNGFDVTGSATNVVVSGFKFTHAAGTALIEEGTSQVRFSRNVFLCSGDGVFLTVSGDDAVIDYNEFGAKKTAGNMLGVSGTGGQVARRLWVHHNYFHDLANGGSEGAQMLRLGLMSVHGQSVGAALVEYNLFSDCRGVTELVSNRSSGNTYRYNTFIDSPTSQLTLRQGNDSLVYGNYFRNTEGLRIYGDRHRVFSNYFESNHIAVAIGNGAPDPTDGTSNKNDRPDDCVIAFNTFIENATHYSMSRRSPEALGATNTIFANNLIQGGETAVKIAGPYPGAVWKANVIWQVRKIGDIPLDGFRQVDPLLVDPSPYDLQGANAAVCARPDQLPLAQPVTGGVKHLQPGSPVAHAAIGEYPGVTFDLDGQPRPAIKSVGADEISSAPVAAHLLAVREVGPNAPEATLDQGSADAPRPSEKSPEPAAPKSS